MQVITTRVLGHCEDLNIAICLESNIISRLIFNKSPYSFSNITWQCRTQSQPKTPISIMNLNNEDTLQRDNPAKIPIEVQDT